MDRVIAIGFFDGVHAGHAAVINAAKAAAGKYGLRPAVLTFDRRPGNAVRNEDARLISDFNAKCCLIESLFGIRDVISLPFDSLLRGLPPEKFVTEYLITRFGAAGAAVGENFRFGRGAAGTPELLSAFLPTVRVSTVQRDGRPVSSGAVREMLASGDIAAANAACGHPYTICGTVEHGFGRGRRMDMPTANLNLSEDLLRLPQGVYATAATVEGVRRLSVTNFGFCPTFEGKNYTVETHIPGYSGQLYGKPMKLEVLAFIRPEMKFRSAAELAAQAGRDAERAREIFMETGDAD